MTAKRKLQFKKVGIIWLSWVLISLAFALSDHLTLHSNFSIGPSDKYSFQDGLLLNLIASTMGALIGGSYLVFFVNEKFRDKPYMHGIWAVLIAYFAIVGFITLVMGFIFAPMQTGKPLTSNITKLAYMSYITNPVHFKNMINWLIVTGFTALMLQMSDKFGQGLLWDFIRGRYHSPKQEERIFMFVDLKSSTTIAEQLGHEKYYELLRDFFSDITDPIIYNKGNIYQYVGDEVVLSWKLQDGIMNNQCVKCYFDMKEKIASVSSRYQKKYGLVPDFKAGMHYGTVTAGEIGIIKRDLTFSGDVLNTAARIQSQCNAHQVDFLSSKKLLDLLSLSTYKTISLGDILLRGKEEKVTLSTVVPV